MKEVMFLKRMVQQVKARRILELGTFDGTSALAMAECLPDDGELITIFSGRSVQHCRQASISTTTTILIWSDSEGPWNEVVNNVLLADGYTLN